MNNKIRTIIISLVFLLVSSGLWAGGGSEKNAYDGIYHGVIPAADCPGIAVVLILNTEGQYKLTYQYIDRGVELFTSSGTFTYDGKTKMITLNAGNLPSYYRMGKNKLTQLDMEGKEITGQFARNYILRKVGFN